MRNGIEYYLFAGVAEWQTRRLQVPVVARLCGFKSHLLHIFRSWEAHIVGLPSFFSVKTAGVFRRDFYKAVLLFISFETI